MNSKITKNVSFGQRRSLFAKRNFFGLGNPVRETGTPAYLRSLKVLPIDFSPPKTCGDKLLGHFDS